MTVFLLVFVVNMGTLVLTDSVLHDAAFTAAQVGGQDGTVTPSSALTSAAQTMTNLGIGYTPTNLSVSNAAVTTSSGAGSSSVCTSGSGGFSMVVVTLHYNAQLLPGMSFLLGLASFGHTTLSVGSSLPLQATGVAQCEIARQ